MNADFGEFQAAFIIRNSHTLSLSIVMFADMLIIKITHVQQVLANIDKFVYMLLLFAHICKASATNCVTLCVWILGTIFHMH